MFSPTHFSYSIRNPNGDTETGAANAADLLPILEVAEMTGASVVIVDIGTTEEVTEADIRAAASKPKRSMRATGIGGNCL
jgi:hypothetical protein